MRSRGPNTWETQRRTFTEGEDRIQNVNGNKAKGGCKEGRASSGEREGVGEGGEPAGRVDSRHLAGGREVERWTRRKKVSRKKEGGGQGGEGEEEKKLQKPKGKEEG